MAQLAPLHRQITLVIFRDLCTRKCEVQILPVSLGTREPKALQEMRKIPAVLRAWIQQEVAREKSNFDSERRKQTPVRNLSRR